MTESNDLSEVARLLDLGDSTAAYQKLLHIYDSGDQRVEVRRMLQGVAQTLARFELAIQLSIDLTAEFPNSELDSVSLFLCYYGIGDLDSAFSEMKRLIAIGWSQEYSRILADTISELGDILELTDFESEFLIRCRTASEFFQANPSAVGRTQLTYPMDDVDLDTDH